MNKKIEHIRNERKSVQFTVVTTLNMRHTVKEYCEKNQANISTLINSLLEEHFKTIGFVASPLPLNPEYEARFDGRDMMIGPDYEALRAFLLNRRLPPATISAICRVKYLCGRAHLTDDDVLKHSSYILLHMLRESEKKSLSKSMETHINWYKDFLRYSRGAIGDDLHCKKEVTA